MEITYNLVNLPSKIYGWGDYSDYYLYLADGTKIQHEYSDGQQDDYRGSLVYYSNGQFSAPFGGGRLVGTNNGTDSEAHYFVTDHLGSTRVVAKVTASGREDLDRKDYYPFGKAWKQPDMPTSGNRYTFSGKEQQRAGLASTKLLDFGARFYDPDGVTFLQQDPLLEKFYRVGPYNYCMGNPVRLVDADGRIPFDTVWDALNILYDIGAAVGNHIMGDHESAKSHWVDLGADAAAFVIPYVPAGASKAVKGADKAVDAVKAADKAVDATKAGEKAVDATKTIEGAKDAQKLIGPAGDAGGTVTKQIPDGWTMEPSNKGGGTKFKDPANPSGNHVRVQGGNPNSPNPAQRSPYVKETRNGVSIDKNGNPISSKDPNAHIPRDEYKFNK